MDLLPHHLLHYRLDTNGFPASRGSLLAWFKPHEDLDQANGFLLEAAWAGFSVVLGPRLMVYYTSDPQKHIGVDLGKFKDTWKDTWHLLAVTWDEGKREVFVDGESVAAVDGIPLYPGDSYVSPDWAVGYLPSCPGRPPMGFVNAVLDDFAVLGEALTLAQVQTIWSHPQQSLLSLLGMRLRLGLPRRVYVRGEDPRSRSPARNRGPSCS